MLIRIVSVPPGEAPEHIRAAWVGLVLPTTIPEARWERTIGVLSAPKSQLGWLAARLTGRLQHSQGFVVESNKAIDLLAAQVPEAAEWWRQNTPHLIQPGQYLLFQSEACEPLTMDH